MLAAPAKSSNWMTARSSQASGYNRLMNGSDTEEVAFGGGCFWCTEAAFLDIKGVSGVTPGYAGGQTKNPTYEEVSAGNTGHAEVILLEYNSTIVSFEQLLDVFFTVHNPTERNRQGADVGTQYRSVVLYSSDEQRIAAKESIKKLDESGKYEKPIVTKLEPLRAFYPAEQYHQKYYATHSDAPYSQIVIAPKLQKLRTKYPNLLKDA